MLYHEVFIYRSMIHTGGTDPTEPAHLTVALMFEDEETFLETIHVYI
jgi:hypothetical protein